MLANMSERADTPLVDWSELGVSELPTGTVTLLLADVEGSTRLWETQPEETAAAVAQLDHTLAEVIASAGDRGYLPAKSVDGATPYLQRDCRHGRGRPRKHSPHGNLDAGYMTETRVIPRAFGTGSPCPRKFPRLPAARFR
jgi:class 3 adenylate cyclase